MLRNRETAMALNSISKVKSPFSNVISLQSLFHPIKTFTLLKSFTSSSVAARSDYCYYYDNQSHLNSNYPQNPQPNNPLGTIPNRTLNLNNQADQDRNFSNWQSSNGGHNQQKSTVTNDRSQDSSRDCRVRDGYLRTVTGFYGSGGGGGGSLNQESSVGVQRNSDGSYASSFSGNESQIKPNGLNKQGERKFEQNTNTGNLGGFDKNANPYQVQQNENGTYAGGNLGVFDKNVNSYQVQQNGNGYYAEGKFDFKQNPNVSLSGVDDSWRSFNDNPNVKPNGGEETILGTIEELDGFCKENKVKEALEVLELLEKNGVVVDMPRYALLVKMCGDTGVLSYAKSVHGHIIRSAVCTNVSYDNKILEMYIKCGSATDAYQVFEKMPARNMTTWDTMIIGLAKNELGEDAIDLFTQFKKTGLKPDGQMFMSVFYACSVLCDVDEGMLHFESMSKEYGIVPSMEHYTSVVKMLASIGYLDEAKEFIEKMPIEPSVDVWDTLMNISSLHGNIELMDRCASVINDLDPSYLARKSEESSRSFKSSDLLEDKKKPKLTDSLADIGSRTNNFKAGDRSHPDTDKLYRVLKGMSVHLKEAGYVPMVRVVLHDVCQESKEEAIFTHSEKLAVVQGLMNSPARQPIRIMKNLRICVDCHQAMRIVSKITGRQLIIRDVKRFHHFQDGNCTCGDFW